tara:strand:+ start:51 stop:659 length:609 start_codon:yes stop_codon:yes gene_type:complete
MTTITNTNMTNNNLINTNVFRFKFDEQLSSDMQEFARIHKHDSRVDFKENFEEWYNSNEESITREQRRLQEIGFNDDIKIKLFRSIKYYYVKRTPTQNNNETSKNRPEKYVQHTREFAAISTSYISEKCIVQSKSPHNSYKDFCEDHEHDINNEINNLMEKYDLSNENATLKIKKTFKNHYFQLNKKTKNNNHNDNDNNNNI